MVADLKLHSSLQNKGKIRQGDRSIIVDLCISSDDAQKLALIAPRNDNKKGVQNCAFVVIGAGSVLQARSCSVGVHPFHADPIALFYLRSHSLSIVQPPYVTQKKCVAADIMIISAVGDKNSSPAWPLMRASEARRSRLPEG